MVSPEIQCLPKCPKCGTDRVSYEKIAPPRGLKAAAFYLFLLGYTAAMLLSILVELDAVPSQLPDFVRAIAGYFAISGLGRALLVGAVCLIVLAYLSLETELDPMESVAKMIGSPGFHCRLCGHRWPAEPGEGKR